MRKFYLENEYGIRKDMQNIDHDGFMTEPSELGYSKSSSFVRIGDMFVENQYDDEQIPFTSKISFRNPNAYDKCKEFLDFINSTGDLFLIYSYGNLEYRKRIKLKSISKTEMSGNILTITATFSPKTKFYVNTYSKYSATVVSNPMQFPFSFPSVYNDNASQNIDIKNNGHTDAQFKVIINGPAVNPKIILSQNGLELHRCEITYALETGNMIEYSSVDDDMYIHAILGNERINLINCLSLENDNFFKLPTGTSTLKLIADDGFTNPIDVEVYEYYRAV